MKSSRISLKKASIFTIVGGVGWLLYNIQVTFKKLNKTLDTGVIDYLDPITKKYVLSNTSKYIYLHSPQYEKSHSIVDRFWDSITFTYARRLLNIAQNGDADARFRAVESLANINNLDDWHYSLLAHMCDAKTAVGLARSKNVDLKFFVKPPNRYIHYNHEVICKWMKDFLIALNNRSPHPCISYFLDKAFVNIQEVGRMVEHDISSMELSKCIQSADDILPMCIHSILHHSTIDMNARDIILLNGLPLLMEMYKRFKNNNDVLISLAKIMSNISVYPELLQDIYKSGWIGVLAKFLKHKDIRIQGPAAKALANYDLDDKKHETYGQKIYLLHPINRSEPDSSVDVVLVHGLLGGVFFTWRQRDRHPNMFGFMGKKKFKGEIMNDDSEGKNKNISDPATREFLREIEERKRNDWSEIGKDFEFILHDCPLNTNDEGPFSCPGEKICAVEDCNTEPTQCWPKDWLPKDCKNIRVLGINYNTNISMWAPMCPTKKVKSTLDARSEDFMTRLLKIGVGNRPIVWLTHSMGGLLVKNMLLRAWQSQDENVHKLYEQTKGIVFYSTPHRGSHVASMNQTTSLFLWPSMEVRELKEGSPALLKLHDKFIEMLEQSNINVLSFVETQSTIISPLKLNFHFVKEDSAKLQFGEYYQIPLDHLRICKPINRSSFLYRKVVHFIENIKNDKIVK